jgi:diaminopimelate epimerase
MINFYKYEGCGNDFIMINNLNGDINLGPDYIKSLCDRHFGIGADGLILLEKSNKALCFMNYYNSDGTQAEMCGNGIRCTAQFYLNQIVGSPTSNNSEISIDTRAGIKIIIVNDDDTYSVNMGFPVFNHSDFPLGEIKIEDLDLECVSMGNPHAVVFVDNIKNFNIKNIGPKIENDFHFPNKINIEFVEKIDPARPHEGAGGDTNYKVKVWERGCGETLACGTGACAVYSVLNKLAPKQGLGAEVVLEFPGGKLYVSKDHEGNIILRGPATFVFKGEIK